MNRLLVLGLFALSGLLSACSDSTPIAKTCTTRADCAEKQYCTAGVCVADSEAPAVTITAPAAAAFFSSATTSLEGTVTDGSGSGIAAVDYSFDGTASLPLTFSGDHFAQSITLPEVDRSEVTVLVRATDAAGNVASASVAVVVDRLGPTLTVTPPEQTLYRASDVGGTASFSVSATDKSGCARLEWSSDDGATWTESTDLTSASYSVPVTDGLAGLDIRFRVRATDSLGNVSSAAPEPVQIDTVPPALTVTSPSAEEVFAPGSAISIAGAASDQNLASVAAELDGSPLALSFDADHFSAQLPGMQQEAAHTLVITARDQVGNEAVATVHFVVDVAPVLSVTEPADGTLFNLASPASATVAGSISDASTVTLTWQLDDGAPQDAPVEASGAFSFGLPLPDEDRTDHTLTLTATDALGGSDSATIAFVVDRLAPRIVFDSPAEGHVFSRAAAAPASATGSLSDAALVSASWSLDSGASIDLVSSSFAVALPLSDEEDYLAHVLTVTATDSAGNSATVPLHYVVDRVAPLLEVASPSTSVACGTSCGPAEAVANLASPTLHFAGTSSDGGPVSLGIDFGATSATPTGTSPWTYDWTPTADGAYLATVTATDAAGNQTVVQRNVLVDRTAPVMTMLRDGQRLVPTGADLVSFSEAMDTASVAAAATFSPSGATLVAADAGLQAFTASLTPYTVYSLSVSTGAKDRAGNPIAAAASEDFLTATVAPPTDVAIHAPATTPRMAIDADGNPLFAYWDSTSGTFYLEAWNGSAWTRTPFGSASVSTKTRAVYQIEVASPAPTGFELQRTVRILYGVNSVYGPTLYLTSSSAPHLDSWDDLVVYGGLPVSIPELYGSPSFRAECPASGSCSSNTLVSATTADLKTISWRSSESSLLDSKTDYAIPNGKAPYAVRGAGLARAGTGTPELDAEAVYTPTGTEVHTIDASLGGVTAAGAPRFGGAAPSGNAWLAWSYQTKFSHSMCPGGVCYSARAVVACNAMSGSSPWRISSAVASLGFMSGLTTATDLAVGASVVGVAFESESSRVSYGSVANACAANPTLSVVASFEDAIEPTVAVGPDGAIWLGYVEASTGALKLAATP